MSIVVDAHSIASGLLGYSSIEVLTDYCLENNYCIPSIDIIQTWRLGRLDSASRSVSGNAEYVGIISNRMPYSVVPVSEYNKQAASGWSSFSGALHSSSSLF